jgi:hypothetical protein
MNQDTEDRANFFRQVAKQDRQAGGLLFGGVKVEARPRNDEAYVDFVNDNGESALRGEA